MNTTNISKFVKFKSSGDISFSDTIDLNNLGSYMLAFYMNYKVNLFSLTDNYIISNISVLVDSCLMSIDVSYYNIPFITNKYSDPCKEGLPIFEINEEFIDRSSKKIKLHIHLIIVPDVKNEQVMYCVEHVDTDASNDRPILSGFFIKEIPSL